MVVNVKSAADRVSVLVLGLTLQFYTEQVNVV